MKKLLTVLTLAVLTIWSCTERKPAEQKVIYSATIDTNATVLRKPVISVNCTDTIKVKDSVIKILRRSYDSIKRRNDTVWSKLLFANNKIEAVKTYIRIAERNPSQRGFFRGWINALWPDVK
jgi:hypothetical protein